MKNTIDNPPVIPLSSGNSELEEFELDKMSINEILEENQRRNKALETCYDPVTGKGCCPPRQLHDVSFEETGNKRYFLPVTMINDAASSKCKSLKQWQLLRFKHDFEYWCATCVTVLDKVTGRLVRLVLNRAQRMVLAVLERQRLAGNPLRLIMLKARQWGGSTLVQTYMAWIQLIHKSNWNSLICGHLHQTSSAIKGMLSRLLRNYPKDLTPDGERLTMRAFEGSSNVRQLSCGESLVVTGSAQSQDAIRGYDVKMAHLTEVAFWPSSPQHSPEDVIRSIGGTIPLEPLTLLVLESTANGVGNYFHTEWLRATSGTSDKEAVFVPWMDIDIYQQPVPDAAQLIASLDDYEKRLWNMGCTLEKIKWYHHKRREYPSHAMMTAEFPTTAIEAFSATSRNVFDPVALEALRSNTKLHGEKGDIIASSIKGIDGVRFVSGVNGNCLTIWRHPQQSCFRNRYMAVVDIGGSRAAADWTVIAIFDLHPENYDTGGDSRPEVVAQWRGHDDLDLVVWKAAQLAKYYHNALLVYESNSLESGTRDGSTLLQGVKRVYANVYHRDSDTNSPKPGFHTNVKTKREVINNLIAYVRDNAYIEHDDMAINEMLDYEQGDDGKGFAAREGKHDDILMTRAIGLQLIENMRLHGQDSHAENPHRFMGSEFY